MSWSGRQLLWGAAGAVGLMWVIISALASSTFLVAGAVVYVLVLVAFITADVRSHPED